MPLSPSFSKDPHRRSVGALNTLQERHSQNVVSSLDDHLFRSPVRCPYHPVEVFDNRRFIRSDAILNPGFLQHQLSQFGSVPCRPT